VNVHLVILARRVLRLFGRTPVRVAESTPINLTHVLTSGLALRVTNASDWWVYNEVFVDRDYDASIGAAFDCVGATDPILVVDLGANVGYFTCRVVDLARARSIAEERLWVLVVEGSPTVFRELKSRLADACLPSGVVVAIHGLVGQRAGVGAIGEVGFGARNSLFPGHNAVFTTPEMTTLQRVAFVDVASLLPPSGPIALFKCDVEGSEQAVLETYRLDILPRVRVAVIEIHHKLADRDRCVEILASAGLSLKSSVSGTDHTSLMMFVRET
jgi:FkbM family methyltransferase